MGLIYKRTSPSGKYYIGKTAGPENIRWTSHVSEALNPNSSNNCLLLNNAIRKYGRDNFTVEILEDNIPSEQLADKEAYYIEKYHAYYLDPPYMGYNMTRGGEGVLKYSDEEILEAWNEGLTVQKIADKLGASRPTIRYRLNELGISLEERVKRGIESTSRNQSEFELYKDDVIFLYNLGKTSTEIAKELYKSPNTIRKYLVKLGIPVSQKEARKRFEKSVVQLDNNYNFVARFNSLSEAAKTIHPESVIAAKTSISQSAIHKKHRAYGFHWRFEVDYEKGEIYS